MITAQSITDEQINGLLRKRLISVDTAHEAMNATVWPKEREKARARCAEILNQRTKEKL